MSLATLLRPGTRLAVKGEDTVRGYNQRRIINCFRTDDLLARLSAQAAPAGRVSPYTGKALIGYQDGNTIGNKAVTNAFLGTEHKIKELPGFSIDGNHAAGLINQEQGFPEIFIC